MCSSPWSCAGARIPRCRPKTSLSLLQIGGELLDALHSRLRELKAELQVRQQQLATTEAQLLEKDEQLRCVCL